MRAQDVASGKAQFQQTCAFCHGANARGASGPDLIHSALVSHDANGNLIGQVVRNGRPEKGMPAFQLSDDQIRSLAAFLHDEARLAASVYARGPGDYPIEKLLVGSAPAGKQYFETKCAGCHSVSGDLAHIASKYKPVDLQSRIVFPSGDVPTVRVTDSAGKIFTGSQVYADEFTIRLRDSRGWIRSFDRSAVRIEIRDPLAAHVQLLFGYTDQNMHDLFAYFETLK
ncbi:MAG TPA: c-type cytochrome [Bryobacteraceae bacterium]|nr:c-type cytochrome [Bryobacteraceae bacterium]